MRKAKFLIAAVALLGTAGGVLTSCGPTSQRTDATELWICVYDGGYGIEWANTIGAAFEEKTGIPVHVEADTSILSRLESTLKDGGDYDIYMSHGINWQEYAMKGYLAELDDLYESSVEGYEGKFIDRLVDTAAENSKLDVKGNGEEHYYKVCWTQGAGGILYNMDMFEENGWEVPETYDDLVKLCKTINDAGLVAFDDEEVRPFAWSGSERQYYWDYPVFEWWAQMAGLDKVNQVFEYMGPDGTYKNGYEMYNPDTYYKEFIKAYEMWYDLVAVNSGNSLENSYAATLAQAKANFVNEKAAMMPYAQWAKYELEEVTDEGKLDFNVAMMSTPKATADAIDVNYMVGFGDSMIVPANSPNIETAKQFINFMATEESCATFVEKSHGAFLAFDYEDVDLSALEATDTYVKSVHEKLGAQNFSSVSKNPITYATVDQVMPWPGNVYYYQGACENPSANTPEIVGDAVYQYAKSHWDSWLGSAGLRD